MSDMLDPILDERAATFESLEVIYTDAVSTFITALMAFDTAIRDTWGYVPIPRMLADWRGVTWIILNTHGYFGPWLAVEKDFALSRYKTIRDAPDSGDIDFDADSTQTKPTKGAIRVNDLLETITDRYR